MTKRIAAQELKHFAQTMVWAFPLFFSLLLPWIFDYAHPWWPLLVAAAFGLLYLTSPRLIYYPYRAWMTIAGTLGWINTRLILGLTFYVLIFPLGRLLRLLGKLQYIGHQRPNQASYYVERQEPLDRERLERPF